MGDLRTSIEKDGNVGVSVRGQVIYLKDSENGEPVDLEMPNGERYRMLPGDRYRSAEVFDSFRLFNPNPDVPLTLTFVVTMGDFIPAAVQGRVAIDDRDPVNVQLYGTESNPLRITSQEALGVTLIDRERGLEANIDSSNGGLFTSPTLRSHDNEVLIAQAIERAGPQPAYAVGPDGAELPVTDLHGPRTYVSLISHETRDRIRDAINHAGPRPAYGVSPDGAELPTSEEYGPYSYVSQISTAARDRVRDAINRADPRPTYNARARWTPQSDSYICGARVNGGPNRAIVVNKTAGSVMHVRNLHIDGADGPFIVFAHSNTSAEANRGAVQAGDVTDVAASFGAGVFEGGGGNEIMRCIASPGVNLVMDQPIRLNPGQAISVASETDNDVFGIRAGFDLE